MYKCTKVLLLLLLFVGGCEKRKRGNTGSSTGMRKWVERVQLVVVVWAVWVEFC